MIFTFYICVCARQRLKLKYYQWKQNVHGELFQLNVTWRAVTKKNGRRGRGTFLSSTTVCSCYPYYSYYYPWKDPVYISACLQWLLFLEQSMADATYTYLSAGTQSDSINRFASKPAAVQYGSSASISHCASPVYCTCSDIWSCDSP